MDAFHRRWATHARLATDANGAAALRGFFGEYEVRGRTASGQAVTGAFCLPRHSARELTVALS
jgi:hypothetical protein